MLLFKFYVGFCLGCVRIFCCFFNLVCSFGVLFDFSVSMEDYVRKICKMCYFYLNNISKIILYLDCEFIEVIIYVFVVINLDFCNVILYGLFKVFLNCL